MPVLHSAGIGLIFTRSWLGWPKQPIKWDILYHGMSCSVFKWGAGWRRGSCYSGASWALGGENTACCTCFLSVLLIVVFFSLCLLLNCSHSNPRVFAFFLLTVLPIPLGRGQEWESNCVVLLLETEAKPQQSQRLFLHWDCFQLHMISGVYF